MRISGSLVLLEKQKIENGVTMPVAHDKSAHDYVLSFSTRGRASSLSHTQKEFIVKHGCLDKNRDLFLKHMMDNPNVPCSDQQISAT